MKDFSLNLPVLPAEPTAAEDAAPAWHGWTATGPLRSTTNFHWSGSWGMGAPFRAET